MPTFSAEELLELGVRLFTAKGVKAHIAREVVDSLVLNDLLGLDSHGVVRIRMYFDAIDDGAIVPDAEAKVIRDHGAAVVMDGQKAFGQIVARKATKLAIQTAREHSIGAVTFTDVYHIGRLGEYVAMAAEENLIGLMFANGAPPGGLVAPFGARERIMGTNPIAFAIPAGSHPPLVADFATSSVAGGKFRISMRKGEKIPLGLLIDREGKATAEPGDLYKGGAILTFGGHKGYALALLVDVLAGILSGADTPIFPNYKYMHNGVFVLVIDPTVFRPEAQYRSAVDFLFERIKQALPAEGMTGAMIPGEPELRTKAIREREGIPVDDETWAELRELSAALNVSFATEHREISAS